MKKVSKRTIDRALLYIRTLESLIKEKKVLVSSRELGNIMGLTDVQIRKDISNFGRVGTPRVGYQTAELKNKLEDFVLQKRVVRAVLFGAGNLGSAILKYPGFHRDKIQLAAAFDVDPKKIGRKINGVRVFAARDAGRIIKKNRATIGILAVPKEHAQPAADQLVAAGLRGIVNFTPSSITVPKRVLVRNIDLTIEFLALFCGLRA